MFKFIVLSSFLDNDFYKFTMQNAVIKLFPYAQARYKLINRGKHIFPKGFNEVFEYSINEMAKLKLTLEERNYIAKNCPYLDEKYLDFLQNYSYNPSEVKIIQNNGDLKVFIEGFWYRTILWESPLMAIISELFYKLNEDMHFSNKKIINITRKKISKYKNLNVPIAEFGTRRRHSYKIHRLVLKTLKEEGQNFFIGTSNVHLSHNFNVKPIGTHGHEWFMFHGAKYGFKTANYLALKNWMNVYKNELGIALSDTYTTTIFFKSFNKKFTKLFNGIRHDSGDPIFFAQKAIEHYQKFKVDPLTKTIIFSDSLNPNKVENIVKFCKGKIGISFGIGTNFTNDVGVQAMNITIKMVSVYSNKKEYWLPVVKLSDVSEKESGDIKMIKLAKQILHIL